MKKFWLAAAALLVAATFTIAGAQAQGVAFNGPYVGLNAGGGWINDNGPFQCVNTANGTSTLCPLNNAISPKISGSGIIGGAQAGYNVPVPMWGVPMVIGAELDFQGSTIKGSSTTRLPATTPVQGGGVLGAPTTYQASEALPWMGTMRARLGYAGIDRLLIYGTAGVAIAQVTESTTFSSTGGVNSATNNNVRAGPVAGLGAEYLLSDRLSLKLEGLYYNLGSDTLMPGQTPAGTFAVGKQFNTTGEIVRIGLNWQFGVAPQPAPAPATPVAVPASRPAPAPAPAERKFIVFFDFDKATLTPEGQKIVDAAAAAYKQGGNPRVQLAGYTDASGTVPYNLKLSQRRADTVSAALVRDGVPKSAIDAKAFGKSNQRVPTADGVREPQNRRVEITE